MHGKVEATTALASIASGPLLSCRTQLIMDGDTCRVLWNIMPAWRIWKEMGSFSVEHFVEFFIAGTDALGGSHVLRPWASERHSPIQ